MTLKDFFTQHPRAALGFSGGVDSSYLLWAAQQWAGQVRAYYVKTPFQPAFEYADAKRLAAELGADMVTIETDPLTDETVRANPADRCYFCKRCIFGLIAQRAAADGFQVLIDGTNASDDAGDRPGMRALAELEVLSPLRLCGITKAEVRQRSKEAGLFTWSKPAYACLATRIPTGTEITHELLSRTERAEETLMDMGFSDFRVRLAKDGSARLQLPADQMTKVLEQREAVLAALREYPAAVLDLKAR